MAVPRPGTRFVSVSYRSSQDSLLLRCSYRYLEALLDGLLARAPERSHWWQDGRKSLLRGAEIRRMRVWQQTPYDPAFSVPALTSSPDSEEFRDEAIWQVARHLDDLYVTIPFSEQDEALIPLEDHRYETHLGAAVLPSPAARSKLPVTIWDMVLRDLTHSVYADFLLWCLQRNLPETARTTSRTFASSSETSSAPFPGALHRPGGRPPNAQGKRFSGPLTRVLHAVPARSSTPGPGGAAPAHRAPTYGGGPSSAPCVSLLLRTMLHTRWDADTWPRVKVAFKKALALRSQIRRAG